MSNALKRMLAQEDTIIFVGSGISKWAGLPSWEELIEQLAEHLEENSLDATLVRQEASAGDLLQAASYGFLKLTPPQIASFLRRACLSGTAVPAAIHEELMNLGPTCFITTNYDDLIEQAYRLYRKELSEPRVVLNTQPFEQAEIIHAQARRFIFKPHGDASHTESIVMTREQYRMLMPEGKFSATLNTFKTLLQSRPVLFLGFGLRDPDFLHLRDLLANMYRGGMRDHYAIVSDPVPDQEDYWRRHYGIHIVGYRTEGEGRDHTGLLRLLKQLRPEAPIHILRKELNIEDPATVLSIARYAASCLSPSATERFTIRVEPVEIDRDSNYRSMPYYHWQVERLFNEGPKQFILLGEPGAGKSFAIREAVNVVASNLQDACLRGELHSAMRIPVALDLKLYSGELDSLISSRFPEGLSLAQLHAAFPVILYLDSYNEIPREFREDGRLERQLDALLESMPGLGFIIGSRTSDGLDRFDVPVFSLAEITEDEVERHLENKGVVLSDTYRADIVRILQRPFYFRLVNLAVMTLDSVHVPGDLYAQFMGSVASKFASCFGTEIDLTAILQKQAYSALEQGLEAFFLSDLEERITAVALHLEPAEVERMTSWLASQEIIIPMRGRRAAFVHQTVTEFLAASELKIHLENKSNEVDVLIDLRRWDNAMFLALGMLEEPFAAALLRRIAARDITFALRAARFVLHGAEELVRKLLEVVAKLPSRAFDFEASFAFERLPFSPSHEPALRSILQLHTLRGAAFFGLAKALGSSAKEEIIDSLFLEKESGPIREIGRALEVLVEPGDLPVIVDRLIQADASSIYDDGLTGQQIDAVSSAVRYLPPDVLRQATIGRLHSLNIGAQRIVAELICDIFVERKSKEGLAMVIEVARSRLPRSLFTIFINVCYEPDVRDVFLDALDDSLFETIVYYIDSGDHWSIQLLLSCAGEKEVRNRVLSEAEKSVGVRRSIFEYCVSREEGSLFAALESWAEVGGASDLALLQLIDFPELDWSDRHEILVKMLGRKDLSVASLILGGGSPPSFQGLDSIDMGRAEFWLNWMLELVDDDGWSSDSGARWVAMQLGCLVGMSSSADNKDQLLDLLDKGTPEQRKILAVMVLPIMEGLSVKDFSHDQLEFLKELIQRGEGGSEFRPHVLASISDEDFLRAEIIPIALKGGEAYDAVRTITRSAGKRLGVRFVLPSIVGESKSQVWLDDNE